MHWSLMRDLNRDAWLYVIRIGGRGALRKLACCSHRHNDLAKEARRIFAALIMGDHVRVTMGVRADHVECDTSMWCVLALMLPLAGHESLTGLWRGDAAEILRWTRLISSAGLQRGLASCTCRRVQKDSLASRQRGDRMSLACLRRVRRWAVT